MTHEEHFLAFCKALGITPTPMQSPEEKRRGWHSYDLSDGSSQGQFGRDKCHPLWNGYGGFYFGISFDEHGRLTELGAWE